MSKSYFADIGILGWDKIEPIILGAILSNKSVLLNGPHGANKTEGCQTISEAVFGEGTKFVPYDTSLVNADDLLGFMNPGKLAQGDIEYIETPDCIWSATSILLDEINRCNPYNAAKFFEIVRSRTINGRPTMLEFVWAACNPPDKYNTAHMDPAQVSRFCVLTIPTFHDLTATERRAILNLSADGKPAVGSLKEIVDQARSRAIPPAQAKAIQTKVLKIAEALNKTKDIQFSGRQVRDLHDLFSNMDRVAQTFDGLEIDTDILTNAVMSLVPEATGLIRSSVSPTSIETEVKGILHGFKLSDPVLTAANVIELCGAKIKDTSGHIAAIGDMLASETDGEVVQKAWQVVIARKDITPDQFDGLRQAFAVKDALLKLPKGAKVEDAAEVLKGSLGEYGPKAPRKGRKNKKGTK
jgi:MoxR-like ATPase